MEAVRKPLDEPQVRADGMCVECGSPRIKEGEEEQFRRDAELVAKTYKRKAATSRATVLAARLLDPFCSTQCAKDYYGVTSDIKPQYLRSSYFTP